MSFTREEALDFISNKLGIADFEGKFAGQNKKNVLDEILVAWQDKIAFQTVSQLAQPQEKKSIPTMDETVRAVKNLEGGNCWTINTSIYLLLDALGYKVFFCISGVITKGLKNHILVVVEDLVVPGDHYVVDVGYSTIHNKAVCLDFDEESEFVSGTYAPYKYIKEDGYYVRLHRKLTEGGPYTIKDGWAYMYWFKKEYLTLDQITELINEAVYLNPDHHQGVEIFCTTWPKGCFTFLHNNKLKVEQSPGGEVTTTILASDDDVASALLKHFPNVPKDVVHKAVVYWSKVCTKRYEK